MSKYEVSTRANDEKIELAQQPTGDYVTDLASIARYFVKMCPFSTKMAFEMVPSSRQDFLFVHLYQIPTCLNFKNSNLKKKIHTTIGNQ